MYNEAVAPVVYLPGPVAANVGAQCSQPILNFLHSFSTGWRLLTVTIEDEYNSVDSTYPWVNVIDSAAPQ